MQCIALGECVSAPLDLTKIQPALVRRFDSISELHRMATLQETAQKNLHGPGQTSDHRSCYYATSSPNQL